MSLKFKTCKLNLYRAEKMSNMDEPFGMETSDHFHVLVILYAQIWLKDVFKTVLVGKKKKLKN